MKHEPADWDAVKNKIQQKYIEEGDCWLWNGYAPKGIPMMRYKTADGKWFAASVRKLSSIIAGRTVHEGRVCIPSCGEPLCINPEHTKILTNTDHLARISELGISGVANIRRSARISETRRAKHAKLTDEDVMQIRASSLTQRELSRIYGICQNRISMIRQGKAWKSHAATPFSGLISIG